jgi:hypothetical protein
LIRSVERDFDGFLKFESLDFFETPSPYGRRGQNGAAAPGRQKAATNLSQFVAFGHEKMSQFAAICRLLTARRRANRL